MYLYVDISPGNILCRSHFCSEIKLIDFGLSVKFDDEHFSVPQISEVRAIDVRQTGEVAYYLYVKIYFLSYTIKSLDLLFSF